MYNIKKGSLVVCITNDIVNIAYSSSLINLTIGKVYEVIDIRNSSNNYMILNDDGVLSGYFSNRFISLRESRSLKLEKLKSISK